MVRFDSRISPWSRPGISAYEMAWYNSRLYNLSTVNWFIHHTVA